MGVATLKGFTNCRTLSGFIALLIVNPGFLLRSNPGLKLANAFSVKFTLRHYRRTASFSLKYNQLPKNQVEDDVDGRTFNDVRPSRMGPAYGSHAQPTDDTDSVQHRTFDIDFSPGCLENEPQGQPGAHF